MVDREHALPTALLLSMTYRTCFRTNRSCRLAPAHQGMKIEALVGGIAAGILSRNVSAWIPAFAGMTNEGVRCRTQQPFKGIFVPIADAGWCRHTKV